MVFPERPRHASDYGGAGVCRGDKRWRAPPLVERNNAGWPEGEGLAPHSRAVSVCIWPQKRADVVGATLPRAVEDHMRGSQGSGLGVAAFLSQHGCSPLRSEGSIFAWPAEVGGSWLATAASFL